MSFIKHSDGEIVNIVKSSDEKFIDDNETSEAIKKMKKNLKEDGNKIELDKELD